MVRDKRNAIVETLLSLVAGNIKGISLTSHPLLLTSHPLLLTSLFPCLPCFLDCYPEQRHLPEHFGKRLVHELFLACGDDALSKEIEKLNKELPMDMGDGFSWASVSLKNGVMTFNYTVDESLAPGAIKLLNANKAEMDLEMIQQIRQALSGDEDGKEAREIISQRA